MREWRTRVEGHAVGSMEPQHRWQHARSVRVDRFGRDGETTLSSILPGQRARGGFRTRTTPTGSEGFKFVSKRPTSTVISRKPFVCNASESTLFRPILENSPRYRQSRARLVRGVPEALFSTTGQCRAVRCVRARIFARTSRKRGSCPMHDFGALVFRSERRLPDGSRRRRQPRISSALIGPMCGESPAEVAEILGAVIGRAPLRPRDSRFARSLVLIGWPARW